MKVFYDVDIIAINEIKVYLLNLQERICAALEREDSANRFVEDVWQYAHKEGGGRSRVLSNGAVFEQAGVNFSHVFGGNLPSTATIERPELAGCQFQALGVSAVIHPRNPYVPTAHLNVRFFYAEKPNADPIWWFGGGYDLTPYYGFIEDCQHWHQTAKEACDLFGKDLYPRFKNWADKYFYLKHRQEPRGIGGVFFDDFNELPFRQCFAFMCSIGDSFINAYLPIVERRKNNSYGQIQRDFQCYRRGRYVEFNLIHDRGTLFGLQSAGRVESILMSLPPKVIWRYNWNPQKGTEEARLYEYFLVSRDWASMML